MTLPANRITFITLTTTDLPRARAYYEALGWVPQQAMEQVCFYRLHGQMFALFTREGLARETGLPVEHLQTGAATLAQNQPDKAGVDAAYAHALACGATPVRAPFETDWGGYSSYVADPDGYQVELVEWRP